MEFSEGQKNKRKKAKEEEINEEWLENHIYLMFTSCKELHSVLSTKINMITFNIHSFIHLRLELLEGLLWEPILSPVSRWEDCDLDSPCDLSSIVGIRGFKARLTAVYRMN